MKDNAFVAMIVIFSLVLATTVLGLKYQQVVDKLEDTEKRLIRSQAKVIGYQNLMKEHKIVDDNVRTWPD